MNRLLLIVLGVVTFAGCTTACPDGAAPVDGMCTLLDIGTDGGFSCVECQGATPVCDQLAQECVGCILDSDCGDGVCDFTRNECVACRMDADCAVGSCNTVTNTCIECRTQNDCLDAAEPFCSSASQCVECLGDADCVAGVCDTGSGACVDCVDGGDCSDPNAAACDEASNTCVACVADADCTSVAGSLSYCESGVCVACTPSTQEVSCGANSCSPETFQCGEHVRGSRGICETCVADSDCGGGRGCVALELAGEHRGNYCLERDTGGGCGDNYLGVSHDVLSVSGQAGPYCGPNTAVTTCEAVIEKSLSTFRPCDSLACDAGQACVPRSGGPPDNLCQIRCQTNQDCEGLETCQPGGYCLRSTS